MLGGRARRNAAASPARKFTEASSRMMKSGQTMAVRTFTCPKDNAQFQEPDAARLCVQCKEPFLPRDCQIKRCSSCGTEARNGGLACERANGRLQVAGSRCPSCRHEG